MPEDHGTGNNGDVATGVACGGCASAGERCGNGLEKIYPTTAVRFGTMNHIGEFSHPADMKFSCGAKVVISSERGIEIGDQVSLTCFGCDKSVNRDQMRSYAEASGGETFRLKSGRILREATPDDLHEWKHIQEQSREKLATCRRLARELELDMKIVDCEHVFGGERVVFYFMAEERIDFRDLVRMLASEFQTRIEMRQIGARDEARLLADVETCGRECCCKNFLKTLKPISMSMAKLQKTTLDIAKVSGRCGRLKCCLRYEHESYQEMSKKLPRVGMRIRTNHGTGRVVDRQILTQLVKIHTDEGKFVTVVVEDIVEWNVPEGPPPQEVSPPRGTRRSAVRPANPPGPDTPEAGAERDRDSRSSRRSHPSRNRPPSGSPARGAPEQDAVAASENEPMASAAAESETEQPADTPPGTSDRRRRKRRRSRDDRRPTGPDTDRDDTNS